MDCRSIRHEIHSDAKSEVFKYSDDGMIVPAIRPLGINFLVESPIMDKGTNKYLNVASLRLTIFYSRVF